MVLICGEGLPSKQTRSWWLGGLALSKATCVVTVTIVFPLLVAAPVIRSAVCVSRRVVWRMFCLGSCKEVLGPMKCYLYRSIVLVLVQSAFAKGVLRAPKSWPQHDKLLEHSAR